MSEEKVKIILNNQTILDNKLDQIINEISKIKSDLSTTIKNQKLLEQYEMDITERLKRIERK
jgi:hypothetical protein|tara:strand:+ start:67 stop:252 length:186 start_codon:yes stop_codon:yes gene_type:complete